VIVGHSLGGFLVYRLGATEPDLVGPLIAVDGMPCLMAIFSPVDPSPEALKKQAAAIQAGMEKASRETYMKNQKQMVGGWLQGRKEMDTVLKWGADSDQATVARAMGELFGEDARPDLARIKAPLLLIAAFNKSYNVPRETVAKRVEAQLAKAPKHELAVSNDSRHFIMYDDPEWLWKTMDEFLTKH
jgi:pimeloyl-ACP methyl ester carboxylesterase